MNKSATRLLITCVGALVFMTGLHSSARTQDRPAGYWEIEKGEIVVTWSDGTVSLTKPFDLKKGGETNTDFVGTQPAGIVQWQIKLIPKDVPEIIKGDQMSVAITGHIYVAAQAANGWPDFVKFGINDDGQTASGETLTGFGNGEGYTNTAKLGKPADVSFSTGGLSVPKTAEDFAVRVMVKLTNKATIDYKDASTYAFIFHYKWRTGTPSSDSRSGSGESSAAPSSSKEPTVEDKNLEALRDLIRRYQEPVFSVRANVTLEGGDYRSFETTDGGPEVCRSACASEPSCKAYTYLRPGTVKPGANATCRLKSSVPTETTNSCCVSGVKSGSTSP